MLWEDFYNWPLHIKVCRKILFTRDHYKYVSKRVLYNKDSTRESRGFSQVKKKRKFITQNGLY